MRRVSTRSWRRASALAFVLLAVPGGPGRAGEPPARNPTNELTLAGLRPGRSTLAEAKRRFGTQAGAMSEASGDIILWADPCTGRSVVAEVDARGVVQSVTVSSLGRRGTGCGRARKAPPRLTTGRGLGLGQLKRRVRELYGEPGSELPATFEEREFELLFYAFDWAGSDVPQVMEVTCERGNGRVRKITLAYPSL